MTHEIECLLFERWIDKVFSNLQRFRRLDKEMDKILYNLLHERREGQHFRSSEATSCKLTDLYKILKLQRCGIFIVTKGQTTWKWFFQADVSSKKRTNEFNFTTMKPQVDLFSFVCWRKLRHFEFIWPLEEWFCAKTKKWDYIN